MQNSEVSCVRYLDRPDHEDDDYINRVVLTLPHSVYEGTWTHSSLSLLCITMIMCVRRKILNFCYVPQQWHHELGLLRRFFARVEHKVVVGVDVVQYAYRY